MVYKIQIISLNQQNNNVTKIVQMTHWRRVAYLSFIIYISISSSSISCSRCLILRLLALAREYAKHPKAHIVDRITNNNTVVRLSITIAIGANECTGGNPVAGASGC